MKVNWDGDLLTKSFDQLICGVRVAESRHVLEGKNVCSHYFQLLRHLDVIFERIFITIGAKDVARVTNSGFANRVCMLTNRIHGDLEIRQIVK